MNWLFRLLGYVPSEERRGIRLESSRFWKVTSVRDAEVFLKSLPLLMPEGSVLYLEDLLESEVRDFVEARPAPNPVKVALGTIWPRPHWYHMPLTQKNVTELAELVDEHSVALLCIHIHAYHEGKVLLEWHDAFGKDRKSVV